MIGRPEPQASTNLEPKPRQAKGWDILLPKYLAHQPEPESG